MMCSFFRICLDDENPSRASHDADPEYLRLRPRKKHPDPHDKTCKTDILETSTTNSLVSLSVPHRHPLGLNTICSGKRAHSSKNSHSAIMKINQSKDWDAEKLHVDAMVPGPQPAQAGT